MTLKTYEGIKTALEHFKCQLGSTRGLEIAVSYLAAEIDALKEQNSTNKSLAEKMEEAARKPVGDYGSDT